MMTFSEWIATQDPTKWDLDQASIQSIEDYFHYREICDDDKMELFFWRTLNMYRPRYKAILRVESMDFDPLVNRYFEGQFIGSDTSTGSNSLTSSGSVSNSETLGTTVTTQGQHSDTESGTSSTDRDVSVSGTSTTDRDNVQTLNTTDRGTTDDQKNYSSQVDTDDDRTTTYNITDSTDIQHTGKVEEDTTTDRDNTHTYNSVKDQNSGTIADVGTNNTTTTDQGTSDTDVHNARTTDASSKEANKVAPMSAVGVGNNGSAPAGGGTGDPSGINRGRLTGLDFTYATGYAQKDAEGNEIGHEASVTNNSNTNTVNGRTGNTRTLTDAKTRTGNETDDGTETIDFERTLNTRDHGTANARTGTERVVIDNGVATLGQERVQGSSSLAKTGTVSDAEDIDVTTSETTDETVDVTESKTASGTTSGTQSTTGTNRFASTLGNQATGTDSRTSSSTNTNRYTGREGLTPQEAMARATDYLMGYSTAFQWLVHKLEICFIGIYDL